MPDAKAPPRIGREGVNLPSVPIVPFKPEKLSAAVQKAEESLRSLGAPEAPLLNLSLALEELGANAIAHGGASQGSIEAKLERGAAIAVLIDNGRRFNAAIAAKRAEPPKNPETGGQGLRMVECFTDTVSWKHKDGENRTRVRVLIPRKPSTRNSAES